MDKIVEIKRKNGVAAIRLLSGETLRAPSALYLERRLRIGQSIDPDAYRQFLRERGYPHALEAAMKYLALRERSEKEVVERLRRSCFDEAVIARVMDTLQTQHLLSDARFAEQWAHSRARKYGKNRIAQELRMKGISDSEARAALDAVPEEEEYLRALEQARRLSRKFQGDEKKMFQSLVRKGYSFSMAKKAAHEAANAPDA